ncbi:FUN14 domain-containing protein 2-like isoform X2 [Cimex lectularius]|nr:FUN14 domain-containing protein 2-like isoform X2 [Cimex lectularius]
MPTVTNRGGSSNETDPITIDDVSKEAKNIVDKVIKDVGKTSATKQLIIGCASGWMTGYLMMKVGKVAAVALGGGIILLQVANHNGYVKVNWDRLYKKVDEVGDAVETSATKKGPKLMDKVERFVDRKLDKVESALKKKERKAKTWYHRNVLGDEAYFAFQEIHVFLACFVAGLALGVASGRIL